MRRGNKHDVFLIRGCGPFSRRSVLRGMGLGLAGAVLPSRFVFAADPISPVMTKLSDT